MDSFCSVLVDRGLVSLDALDAALWLQLLGGGDVVSNVLAAGGLKENTLQRLLAEHFELPAGPRGQLPLPPSDVATLVSTEVMRRLRVFPYKRAFRTLNIAVDAPLGSDAERELRALVPLQLRPTIVNSVRLDEALWRHSGIEPVPHLKRLIESLAESAPRGPDVLVVEVRKYRRMSEFPGGVRVSQTRSVDSSASSRDAPMPSEGPAPDSPGLWLDRLVQARRDAHDASPSPPSEPPTTPLDSIRAGMAASFRHGTRPPLSVTIPAASFDPPVDAPAVAISMSEALAGLRALSPPGLGFRHRGPLDATVALAFAREAKDCGVVLQIVARFTQQYFERVLVFVVAGEVAEVRLSHGTGDRTSGLLVPLSRGSLLGRARFAGVPLTGRLGDEANDELLRVALGEGDAPPAAAVVPIAFGGRVVALVYGDDLDVPVTGAAVGDVQRFCSLAATEMARIVTAQKSVNV